MSSGCSQERELSSHWHLLQDTASDVSGALQDATEKTDISYCFKKTGDFNVN
jgi:hypothetical protein